MKQIIKINKALIIVFSAFFVIFAKDNGKNQGFSVKNLNKLPSYERYEFSASGSSIKEAPVILEYSVEKNGKESDIWTINGSMPLNETFIKEQYKVRLSDLNVTDYSRTQKFKRGKHTMSGKLEVNIYTGKPDEFIITTLQPIMYLLRTFPLQSDLKEIYVRLPQQKRGKMNLKVKNKGLKQIETEKYGTVKAYNIEVSLVVPVVGSFLPNIDYYFLDDDVHTLVAMKGVFSMTGKNMEVQLVDYKSR